jgi:hypothetical protein
MAATGEPLTGLNPRCEEEGLLDYASQFFEVVDETSIFEPPGFIVRRAKNGGGMNGSHHVRSKG